MRRLIIEVDVGEFVRLSGDKSIEKIKSLEVLNFIKQDPKEFSMICSVQFSNPDTGLGEIFSEPGIELQILDREKNGKYTILFKSKPQIDPQANAFWAAGGYLLPPLEIKNGKVKMTFMGSAKQVRVLPAMLKRAGVRYKVLQYTDASFSPVSPLGNLTEKQRRVLTMAYNLGYYDLPRRIGSQELASKLKIGSSALIKHRRKAERRLLSAVLGTEGVFSVRSPE
jgi:predicted DNA binding protein